ncbi:MAG: YqeG family HAD IIIA-type phosphatase [Oscillospiraceae bacterium]|nr:YqeG family HAD IIIA-type phosphatase [Oscillospiraceae bacterium]
MSFSPIPKYSFRNLTNISPDFLNQLGIKFLMLDLDNTIASYSEHIPSEAVSYWADNIKKQGIELYVVSNSLRKKRIRAFEKALNVGIVMNAHKPSPKCILQAMANKGYSAQVSALAGDQIFTDTLAANRAGITSIIVKPKQITNPVLALRYFFELPFRAMCKNIDFS